MVISIVGHFGLDCGYGKLATMAALALIDRGFDVELFPISIGPLPKPTALKLAKHYTGRVSAQTVLHIQPAYVPPPPAGRLVWITMNESSSLGAKAVSHLNAARLVLVPNETNAYGFAAEGVTTDISILPLGVDTTFWRPAPIGGARPIVFGTGGHIWHAELGEAYTMLVNAFTKAFCNGEEVSLKLKFLPDAKLPERLRLISDPRISVQKVLLTDERLRDWYWSLHWFISPAVGEGWGYMNHEALSCGRPIIVAPVIGSREYFSEQAGIALEFALCKGGQLNDLRAHISEASMVCGFRSALTLDERYSSFAKAARERATRFDSFRFGESLAGFLRACAS